MPHSATSRFPILIVDDESEILYSYSIILKSVGLGDVTTIEDSREVMPFLAKEEVALIMMDLYMPNITGHELLKEIRFNYPDIPVIVITAANEIEVAVECMRAGATDYLVKPVEKSRLISSVEKVAELCTLKDEVTLLKQRLLNDSLSHEDSFASIITVSKKMRSIFQYIEAIAGSDQPVMITGETGAGKELIARAVHDVSGRKGAYVAVNIAGLDDNMFSDTLFGHKKGAYTGADQDRPGLVVQAAGGTLFIDEIGDLHESSQVKLLRLLQEKEYYSLGSDMVKKSRASVILATNRNVQKLMEDGKFRKDLYYRLKTHQINIPTLRERIEDIPLLLNHFLEEAATSLKKKKPTPPPELTTLLSTYRFPGNLRELKGMVYDAVARHKTGMLSMDSFREAVWNEQVAGQSLCSSLPGQGASLYAFLGRIPTFKEMETLLIKEALAHAQGNQGIAASLLGVSRQALNRRLKP